MLPNPKSSQSSSSISSLSQEFNSKLSSHLISYTIQASWKPVNSPILTNPFVLRIIKQFRNNSKRKDFTPYGNLAIRQAMRYEQLDVTYEGTWKNNIPEGYGIFYYDSGIYYEGYINRGELEGYGLLIMENQEYFYGDFKKNRPQGIVTFEGYNIKVKGVFAEGEKLIHGEIISYKEKTKTTILSENLGVIEYDNGMVFEGSIKNGKPHGKGKIAFPDGNLYEGNIENEMFNGPGVYTWVEGFRFQGSYQNNSKQGMGKFYHTPKLVEQCMWKKGQKLGNIQIFFESKLIYTGIDQNKINQIIQKYFYN